MKSKFTLLQSKFFSRQNSLSKIQKKNLAGKKFTLQMNEVQLPLRRTVSLMSGGLSGDQGHLILKLDTQKFYGKTKFLKLTLLLLK